MSFIKKFKQLSKKDTSIAGGKGASLGEMTNAKIPVPPGFVILSRAFDSFIGDNSLAPEIEAALDSVNHTDIETVERCSETVQELILKSKIKQSIAAEITNSFKSLKSKYVAVRSSATAEDSSTAAWAGQLQSFLFTTEKTLLDNVKSCWASLFSPRAIFYRFEKGLHKQKISVAVVVQKMVNSEVAGVAFSVHPVTKDRNQLIIEAGFGLGEAVVSGQITPDSYVVDKEDFAIIENNVSEQERQIVAAKSGGITWNKVPAINTKKPKLNDKQIISLSKLVVLIEKHYKFPVDIEWALEKGKFYITQSRPITTLGK
ncbi:MAG: PEP/pyruvate-binding domain-containing protein [Candidatus Woesearchaeota archaeon]